MKYFNFLFDNINYTIDENTQAEIRDIFVKYKMGDISDDILKVERVYPRETLHKISYRLYGTIDYWWILADLNDLNDIFDIYYDEDLITKRALKDTEDYFYGKSYTDEEFTEKYIEYYNNYQDNIKNTLIVINEKYIQQVLIKIIKEKK